VLVVALLRLVRVLAVGALAMLCDVVATTALRVAASHAKAHRAPYRAVSSVPGIAVVEALARRTIFVVLLRLEESLHCLHSVKVAVLMPKDERFLGVYVPVKDGLVLQR